MIFQLDLAHSLMDKGLLMVLPDVANFKKPKLKLRPVVCGSSYQARQVFV
jgi:hypothetical protein